MQRFATHWTQEEDHMMNMRVAILAPIAAFSIFTLSAAAGDDAVIAEIIAAKTALDTAFQDRDAATIEALVTPDHLGVATYYGRPYTTADQLATLAEFEAHFFDFSDLQVTLLADDAALVTFENSYTGTFQGRPLPSRVFVSEMWHKLDGKWLQGLYQETPIAP